MLELLKQRSFASLTVTQFLGAFNDNAFKQLVLLLIVSAGAAASVPWIAEHPLAISYGQALPSALFALPFVLFGALTGSLADRVSKSRVIRTAKLLEIGVMGLALVAFLIQSYGFLLVVLFLMGTQSAIFGPSKYGSIPELLDERDLSQGNAVVQMTTMIAIILGVMLGGLLTEHFVDALWIPGTVYVGLALAGTVAAMGVRHLAPADPGRRMSWNVAAEVARHARAAKGDRPLVLSLVASAFFYLVAATLILVVNAYGSMLGLGETAIALLNALTAIGIAVGSAVAGRLSRDRIESGLVPLGLAGLAVSLAIVQLDPRSVNLLRLALFGAGVSAGLFSIPIRALIQARPRPERKGAVLGLSEVLDFTGILAAAGVYWLLDKGLGVAPPTMFLVLAFVVLAFMLGSLLYTAEFALRLVLMILTHSVYRIRVRGTEHLPREGGALLVCNHLSFVDAFLVGAAAPRPVRFLMHRSFFDMPVVGRFARMMGTLPVSAEDSRAQKREVLEHAARLAAEGELVCIFAEGAITRTGAMLPFARGLERIASRAGVPIVPVALDRVWGSIFSFEGARVFWKRPQRLPYPVDVLFGAPLASETPAWEVRNQIAELVAESRERRAGRRGSLVYRFLRSARAHAGRTAIVDSTGARLTYRRLLAGALALRGVLARRLGPEPHVGVLLPPGAGGALANISLALAGRATVNLNYTLSNADLADPIRRCGIRYVVTSRRFLEALGREAPLQDDRVLYFEDLMELIGRGARLRALLTALLPAFLLTRLYDPVESARDTATIVFSSGSTGRPKGVVLSHGNILSNAQGVAQMIALGEGDRVLGVLPFFHSFGYTVTLWAPLLGGATVVYHPNPTDAKRIGELCAEHGVTILLATPTFYLAYLRRISTEQLSSLRLAVAGAEKLRPRLVEAWEKKFGMEILEGYGCTELSPVVSVNVPDVDLGGTRERGHKRGTIGRPLPGTAARIVHPDTFEILPPGTEGLLLVRGPGVMQGYLGDPERTREALRDGWYVTGDVALIDREGFLVITDRLARFSKIGGEMVPHGRVEDCLGEAVARLTREADAVREEVPELAVTSVPDEKKGERLVVLHTALGIGVQAVVDELLRSELPRLFVPRADGFVEVEAIPKLATGKTDLRRLGELARELLGA